MKTNLIKTAGLFMMVALMTTGLNAQNPRQGGRGSGPSGQAKERMAKYLDLTEEQQEAMKALRTENYKTMKPLKNKMVELKARERTLLSEETADLKALNNVIDEQTDLSNKMRKIQLSHKLEVKEILTDEQIMKLDQRRKFSKNRHFRGGGPNKGQGPGQGTGHGQRNAQPYHRNWG
jgi:Spy/CpxP family protein refolding chaperone